VVRNHKTKHTNTQYYEKGTLKIIPQLSMLPERVTNFLAGSLIGGIIVFKLMKHQDSQSSPRLSSKSNSNSTPSTPSTPSPEEKKFHDEQLSRNLLYFGQKNLIKITDSSVVVVGLGGVGSHAAHMLARSGVGNLTLIDFDQVTLSSTNRHASATLADVGKSKVLAMKEFISKITISDRQCKVNAVQRMFDSASASSLLDNSSHDFVIDAIDDIPTKAQLIKACIDRNLNVLSSMGAGGKADPTRMHIGDLKSATKDPLCTKLRWCLKKLKVDIDSPLLKILYSSEKTVAKLSELTQEQKDAPKEFGAVDNMRLRVLPVLGTMPAIMGQACASYVICEVGNKPFSPISVERQGKSVRHKLHQHIKNREVEIMKMIEDGTAEAGAVGKVEVDIDDIEFIMMDMWNNRCAITEERLGNMLEIYKWRIDRPACVENLVLMSARGRKKFLAGGGWKGLEQAIIEKVEKKLLYAKLLHQI